MTPRLDRARYCILDTNPEAGDRIRRLGRKLARDWGLAAEFECTTRAEEAYPGADFVLVTISTGGLDAMEHDIRIPEEYRILHTVGDTVGPGGWSRSLRNIPVAAEMARTVARLAPQAVLLNYTNPMGTLTQVFCEVGRLRTVGLCHGLFEVYADLQKIFGLEREEDIKVRFGGLNHFFWITEMRIPGGDGYALLKKRMGEGRFADLLEQEKPGSGESSFRSGKQVCSELLETFGYLPYTADRHTCEFFGCYNVGDSDGGETTLDRYGVKRTSIAERREKAGHNRERVDDLIEGRQELPRDRSRETAADIMAACIEGRDFIDVVNLPNEGQIPNLPRGTVVETLGVASRLGFTPLQAGNMPEQVLPLIWPHAHNQKLIVEAGLKGDLELALWALQCDPLCAHLTPSACREMGQRLLKANREWLPQFRSRL
jgi:alpha-galactosidase